MSTNLKKSFFGGYDKRSTDEVLADLSAQLERNKAEMSQQMLQMEKAQNEFKVRLSNYEAEIEVKNKLTGQLRQRIEEQDREIQLLNYKLNEQSKNSLTYENGMSRIGEVYSLAYDSARQIVTDAQSGANDLIQRVYVSATQTQDELNRYRIAVTETKTHVAQLIEQAKSQLLLLQDQAEHLTVKESAAITGAAEEISMLKEKALAKINEEIRQFALQNKSFCQSAPAQTQPVQTQPAAQAQPAAVFSQPFVTSAPVQPAEAAPLYYTGAVTPAEAKKPASTWQDYQREAAVPSSAPQAQPEQGYYFSQAMAQRAEAERNKSVAEGYTRVTEPAAATPHVDSIMTAKAQTPEEAAAEYTNKKPSSVKDILKKYSNL